MSLVELIDEGGGRFTVTGELSFASAATVFERSRKLFDDHDRIEVDLSAVKYGDSAGLALLLEWVNWARYYVREIRYIGIPKQILAIARISEVEDMLSAGERWTTQDL